MFSAGRHVARIGLPSLFTAAGYYATGWFGLKLALVHQQVTPLWLPAGLAVVSLLLVGLRALPGVAVGAFAINVTLGPSLVAVVAITAGNTLAPLCAYLSMRRARFRLELDRLRDALALVFLAALGSMLISATAGALSLSLAGEGHFWRTWWVWWTGDTMGVLVIVPLVLALRHAWPPRSGLLRWAEIVALVAGTFGVTVYATTTIDLELLFLPFPLLIWAALRFQALGAGLLLPVVAVVTTYAAVRATGPFRGDGLAARMASLQALNGTAALTALLLAALIAERDGSRRQIQSAAANLAQMTADLERGDRSLQSTALALMRGRRWQ